VTAAGPGDPAAGPGDPAAGPPPDELDAADAPAAPDPVVLDCLGRRCPLPVIALAKRLPTLPLGATVTVLADDPAAAVDIPAWCRMRAQRFVGASVIGDAPAYTVQRLT
jgi:tRNA 2-thiouridine synthesizing protein A